MQIDKEKALLKSVDEITKNHIYYQNGNNIYTNLTTGEEINIDYSEAKKKFRVPIYINNIYSEYPIILELIKKLKLKLDR